jgi:hypothetical protein
MLRNRLKTTLRSVLITTISNEDEGGIVFDNAYLIDNEEFYLNDEEEFYLIDGN